MRRINQKALDIVINGSKEERHFLVERDFSLFFAYYFVDYVKYGFAPFHFDLFDDVHDLLSDKLRELLWLIFRESAKTSIAKALILYLIVFKKRRYINADSFDKENAERVLFDVVVEMQTNPRIILDFGHLYNQDRDKAQATQKRVNNFVTSTGVRVEAHSTGESVRGRIHGHQRPDFLLLDDFETNKTKDSVAHTQQVIAHINEFKAGLAPDAKVLYLGNYITEIGSIQTLIDRSKIDARLRVRNIPVEKEGIIAWPAKYVFTDEEAKGTKKVSLADKKIQLGSSVYSAEMLNQPIDEATAVFFKTMFRYRTRAEVDEMKTRKFATVDTALSRGSKSDYTGITKNYVNSDNDWHFSSARYRIGPKELIHIIFTLHNAGFEEIGIEETAYLEAIKPFFLDECKVRNQYPAIVALSHGGIMKETRIRGLLPRYEAGTVYHIEGECEDLEMELLRFPRSVHDDVMDSAQYQNKIAKPYADSFDYEAFEREELGKKDTIYSDINL